MKRFLLFVLILFFGIPSNADVFKAKTVTSFDSENPPKTLSVKAVSDMQIDDLLIKEGYILNGNVIDLIHPQAYGKNATFSFQLTSYVDLSGVSHNIDKKYVIKYRQRLKSNPERQSFSLMGSCDGGRTETGIEISPYDIKLMKESKNIGEFLWKDMNKDSFWQPGWELKYNPNETIYFNY